MKSVNPFDFYRLAISRGLTRALRQRFHVFFLTVGLAGSTACSGDGQGQPSLFPEASANDAIADGAGDESRVEWVDSADAGSEATVESGLGDVALTDEVAPGATLCVRLNDLQHPDHINQLSVNVTQEYLRLAAMDCEVAKVIPSNDEVYLFANQILAFNLALWGCDGHPRPTAFDLVPATGHELTSADAALLVDRYLQAAAIVLELSPPEEARLRQDLVALSETAVSVDSSDHLLSRCDEDAGGDVRIPSDGPVSDADASTNDGGDG